MLKEKAAQWVARHRRAWPVRWLGQMSYMVWRAYENRDFDMSSNGEEWCVRTLKQFDARCVFDVGANVGDWLRMCSGHLPGVEIHAFEIAPPVFTELQRQTGSNPRVHLNPVGLSDRAGEIEVFCPESANYRTTAFREHLGAEFMLPNAAKEVVVPLKAIVTTGDAYARQHGIEQIDMLKIDVEGMEGSVLAGFGEMLAAHRIRLLQFEYNTTNIVSGFLLRNAYQLLGKHGYRLGKLYPDHVEFRDFHYRHEDFCGPNMIAIRPEDGELRKRLSN